MNEQRIVVELAIAADEYVRMYAGTARDVLASATDGRRVRFPASILRPFVGHDGIHGRFEIIYGTDGRFRRIVPR